MTKTLDKLKTINATLVKELTGGMKNDAELKEGEDMLALASVEITDSDGDTIFVDGIDFSKYHNPPKRHLKLLASHMGSLPSGEPPIIGRIERFFKTTTEVNGKEVKALAFAFSFARDEEGELTPLANAYKRLMPKYLDSFSVGMLANKYEIKEDKSGFNIYQSDLYEISAVAIPANAEANVMQAIKKAFKDNNVPMPQEEIEVTKEEKAKEIVEEPKEEDKKEEEVNTTPNNIEEFKQLLNEAEVKLHKRLDSIESILAVLSQAKEEQTDEPKSASPEEIESLKQIKAALNKIKGLNTN